MTDLDANSPSPQPLEKFARTQSPQAFAAMVERYAGLVYCTCRRHLKDVHLAEDATQAVFLLLSQKASSVRSERLAGWLLTASRYACANIRKREKRREKREQKVAMRTDSTIEETKSDLTDLLDDALHQLPKRDREVLVSRYLDDSPIETIAQRLGISVTAARKRIERAIAAMRRYFLDHGIHASPQSVDAVITEQVRAANIDPETCQALVLGILNVVRAGPHAAGASVAIAKGVHAMMIVTKIKITALTVAAVLLLGTAGWVVTKTLADNTSPLANPPTSTLATSAVPAPAADNPVALYTPIPATQPTVVNLSSPTAAFSSFFAAVSAGDRDAVYKCITADPHRTPTLMDGLVTWNITQNHLTQAAVQSFGGDGAAVTRFTTFDFVWQRIGQFAPPPVITGDNASIDYDISKLPPQVQAHIKALVPSEVSPWMRAIFYLHRQGNQWKFDLDRSMHVVLDVHHKDVPITDQKSLVGIFSANAEICDLVAADIRNGNIASITEASNALDDAIKQVHKKCRYSSLSLKVTPAQAP